MFCDDPFLFVAGDSIKQDSFTKKTKSRTNQMLKGAICCFVLESKVSVY